MRFGGFTVSLLHAGVCLHLLAKIFHQFKSGNSLFLETPKKTYTATYWLFMYVWMPDDIPSSGFPGSEEQWLLRLLWKRKLWEKICCELVLYISHNKMTFTGKRHLQLIESSLNQHQCNNITIFLPCWNHTFLHF